MIKAEEAYKMSYSLLQKKIKRIQNKINRKIKRQIKRGFYFVDIYYQWFPNGAGELILKYYRDMGYCADIKRLKYDASDTQFLLSISWQKLRTAKDEVE